jgi:ABC-2 type transport system permease protein
MRQPAQVVPSIVFPLFLLAVNAAGLDAATKLPGFPTNSYVTFAIAVPFIQAGLFAVAGTGADLARDIETGFLNRLSLTPMSGFALVSGQLAGTVVLGIFQFVVFMAVGLAAGAGFAAGFSGGLVLLALTLTIVFAFGSIGVAAAFRFGNGEAVQGLFPVFFVFLFLSSISLPRDLIQQDWFRTVATWNPVSYMLEGIRSLFITGWDTHALLAAFGAALAIAAVFLVASVRGLRTRLVRT